MADRQNGSAEQADTPAEPTPPGAMATVAAPARGTPIPGRVSRADVDDLTGFPLRRAFLDRTAQVLAESGATGLPVSLLVIDVDQRGLHDRARGTGLFRI